MPLFALTLWAVTSLFFAGVLPSRGAVLVSASDTLSRVQTGVLANHEVFFVTPSGVGAGETVVLDFVGGSGNPFALGAVAFGDVDMAVSSSGCLASFTEETLAALPAGGTWGVSTAGTALTLTSGTGTVPAGRCVRVRIGTNASGGVNQITNPASPSTLVNPVLILVSAGAADTGTIPVSILSDDTVSVSAIVPSFLTFLVSTPSCGLGSLNATTLSACGYTVSTETNAPNGYSTTLEDTTAPTTLTLPDLVTTIPDVSGVMDIGVSEYGVATSDSGGAVAAAFQSAAGCATGNGALNTAATPVDSVPVIVADSAAATVAEVVTLCHKATVSSTQASGTYSNVVTLTSTANP